MDGAGNEAGVSTDADGHTGYARGEPLRRSDLDVAGTGSYRPREGAVREMELQDLRPECRMRTGTDFQAPADAQAQSVQDLTNLLGAARAAEISEEYPVRAAAKGGRR